MINMKRAKPGFVSGGMARDFGRTSHGVLRWVGGAVGQILGWRGDSGGK